MGCAGHNIVTIFIQGIVAILPRADNVVIDVQEVDPKVIFVITCLDVFKFL